MGEPGFTLGDRWLDHLTAGLDGVLSLNGRPGARAGLPAGSTPETLVSLLQDVVAGRWQGFEATQSAAHRESTIVSSPPQLSSRAGYLLIGWNAETARSRLVSTTTGGVIFEDPFWALLAAHAASRKMRVPVGVPWADGPEDLWKRAPVAARAITVGQYQPEDFFGPILGWVPPAERPKFELLTVGAEQVSALRARGVQALKVSRPPKFFELYHPPMMT